LIITLSFFLTIKTEPNLPLTNLKRETVNCNPETLFQTKLSEVLYEDDNNIPKKTCFFTNQFFNQLNNLEKNLFSEVFFVLEW